MIHRAWLALERAFMFAVTAALVVGFASVTISVLLEQVLGMHVAIGLVAVVLTAVLVWVTLNTKPAPPPAMPAPPPPRRPPSPAEVEALLALRQSNEITADQFKAALGDLIPPEPPRTAPADDVRRRGR